ncbi:MAG: hypothetical protein V2I43_14365, partial [Parvularcula sp.]|nr:hypothetical protein [Parvularcula sp.]
MERLLFKAGVSASIWSDVGFSTRVPMNAHFRTFLLMAAMTALFGVVGMLIGGRGGLLLALGFAAASNLFAYWNADKIVLRMYRAREILPDEKDRRLRRYAEGVAGLAARAGMPEPKIYVIDQDQ